MDGTTATSATEPTTPLTVGPEPEAPARPLTRREAKWVLRRCSRHGCQQHGSRGEREPSAELAMAIVSTGHFRRARGHARAP